MSEDRSTPSPPPSSKPRPHAHHDTEAVRLGRFLPLGMLLGALAGALVGWIAHRPGIFIPAGIAVGILLAGTLPVFRRRS